MSDAFAGLQHAVPFVRSLGLEEVESSTERTVLRLPDVESQRNHVGGPHAGAMFSLGESASGTLVLTHFAEVLDRATPLAVEATIRYVALALGPIDATATMARAPHEVLDELANGARPEFDVEVALTDRAGTPTAEMTVRWTLKPNRRAA